MILTNDELNPQSGNIPVNNGQIWNSRPSRLFTQVTNVTLTAAATASIVSTTSAGGSPYLPAGLLNVPGRALAITFAGWGTTAASAEGTIIFLVKLGSTIIATSAAITLVASQTTIGFTGYCISTVKKSNTAGGTGSIDTVGTVSFGALSATLNPPIVNGSTGGTIAPGTPGAVDQTTQLLLDVQTTLSAGTNTFVFSNVVFKIAI